MLCRAVEMHQSKGGVGYILCMGTYRVDHEAMHEATRRGSEEEDDDLLSEYRRASAGVRSGSGGGSGYMLDRLRDLSLDLLHNDTCGVSHPPVPAMQGEMRGGMQGGMPHSSKPRIRFKWDDLSQRAVQVAGVQAGGAAGEGAGAGTEDRTEDMPEDTKQMLAAWGGYWWGGVDPSSGLPSLTYPHCATASTAATAATGATAATVSELEDFSVPMAVVPVAVERPSWNQLQSFIEAIEQLRPLEVYQQQRLDCNRYADDADDAGEVGEVGEAGGEADWPALLLQSGAVTLGSRHVEVHRVP